MQIYVIFRGQEYAHLIPFHLSFYRVTRRFSAYIKVCFESLSRATNFCILRHLNQEYIYAENLASIYSPAVN